MGHVQEIAQALKSLPSSSVGKNQKIYNSNWTDGPLILYHRPDLRFVDLLDPMLLYIDDEEKSHAKMDLMEGRAADPFFLVRSLFDANYVLSDSPSLDFILKGNPQFRILSAEHWNAPGMKLYSVADQPNAGYVRKFLSRNNLNTEPFWDLTHLEGVPDEVNRRVHLDFASVLLKLGVPQKNWLDFSEETERPLYCQEVEPTSNEIARRSGATFLAVGGEGNRIRVSINQKEVLIDTDPRTTVSRLSYFQDLIALPKAIQKGDRLRVKVCAEPGVQGWGLNLILWKKDELFEFCPETKALSLKGVGSTSLCGWSYLRSEYKN